MERVPALGLSAAGKGKIQELRSTTMTSCACGQMYCNGCMEGRADANKGLTTPAGKQETEETPKEESKESGV